jgi:hypothetical protein
VSFIIADDHPANSWRDPERPTEEEIAALVAAYLAARGEIARLEGENARLRGEQEVIE